MGNVQASGPPAPPPPPPAAAPLPPPPVPEKKEDDNPGPMEDLHKKCKGECPVFVCLPPRPHGAAHCSCRRLPRPRSQGAVVVGCYVAGAGLGRWSGQHGVHTLGSVYSALVALYYILLPTHSAAQGFGQVLWAASKVQGCAEYPVAGVVVRAPGQGDRVVCSVFHYDFITHKEAPRGHRKIPFITL